MVRYTNKKNNRNVTLENVHEKLPSGPPINLHSGPHMCLPLSKYHTTPPSVQAVHARPRIFLQHTTVSKNVMKMRVIIASYRGMQSQTCNVPSN